MAEQLQENSPSKKEYEAQKKVIIPNMKLPKGTIKQRYWQFNKQMSPRVVLNQAAIAQVEFGRSNSIFKDRSKSISVTQRLKALEIVKTPQVDTKPRLGQVSFHNFAFTSATPITPKVDHS